MANLTIHRTCIMGNTRNETLETYLQRLSLAMMDIHYIVTEDSGETITLKVRNNYVEVENGCIVPFDRCSQKRTKLISAVF